MGSLRGTPLPAARTVQIGGARHPERWQNGNAPVSKTGALTGLGVRIPPSPYTSYGFVKKEDGRHTIFTHPSYPHLQGAVARHRYLHRSYVTHALKLLDMLDTLKGEKEQC